MHTHKLIQARESIWSNHNNTAVPCQPLTTILLDMLRAQGICDQVADLGGPPPFTLNTCVVKKGKSSSSSDDYAVNCNAYVSLLLPRAPAQGVT